MLGDRFVWNKALFEKILDIKFQFLELYYNFVSSESFLDKLQTKDNLIASGEEWQGSTQELAFKIVLKLIRTIGLHSSIISNFKKSQFKKCTRTVTRWERHLTIKDPLGQLLITSLPFTTCERFIL